MFNRNSCRGWMQIAHQAASKNRARFSVNRVYCTKMMSPILNQIVKLLIKGKSYPVTCVDVFDGGYGYYFDALFPKTTRQKFSTGQQCGIPELGEKCLADFVSYSQNDRRKVRFLIQKWA